MVHYVPVDLDVPNPVCRAAVVTALQPDCGNPEHLMGCVDLHVMHRTGCGPVDHVPYDVIGNRHLRTWHWPERV
jgi:hypothetical protein